MITIFDANKITNKCVESLDPMFASSVKAWLSDMISREVHPYIYYGFRSDEEQQRLYDAYVAKTGPRAAPPGSSFHGLGLAIDWVPLGPANSSGECEALWDDEKSYKIGEEAGKIFGLAAISIETGHLQDARYKTIQEAKAYYDSRRGHAGP